jgi:hypothetical protein
VCKNAVQVFRVSIIARVWQIQLVCQVIGDPLRQLEWKKLQKGMVQQVCILESLDVSLLRTKLLLQQHDIQRWSSVMTLERQGRFLAE